MKSHVIAAAIFALAATGASHAASTLTSSVLNFKVTAPEGSFTWISSNGTLLASAQDLDWTSGQPQFKPAVTDTATIPADNTASVTSAGGSKATSTFNSPTSTLEVSTGAAGGHAEASRSWTGWFYIKANTTVVFEWDSQVFGSNSGNGGLSVSPENIDHMYVEATVSVGNQTRRFKHEASGMAFEDAGFELGDTTTEHYSITFKNTTDSPMRMSFHSNVKAVTHDVAAVPEPEGIALALGGLAALGFMSRRRNARG